MIREFMGNIYEKIYYFERIALSYDKLWLLLGIVAAAGLLFFLFLKAPKA